jgi:hypothetical protein
MAIRPSRSPETKGCAGNEPGTPKAKHVKATKELRVLAELTRGSLHRFQAEVIGDHCLPSTVSGLIRRYGLLIDRDWIRVPTRVGSDTEVKRYWLNESSRELAGRILAAAAEGSRHD